jgi:xylulokinase
MTFVMGVDSSTQSCKVVVRDIETDLVVRTGFASHPPGTEVHPEAWWNALIEAVTSAGGMAEVGAISIAGQQHGLVALDVDGQPLRPALLWNDTRSSHEAEDIVERFGKKGILERTGSLPVAATTSTKLLWVARNEPQVASRIAAVCLPHDYLSWRLSSSYPNIDALFTDRSDASGTGYFNPETNQYDKEIIDFCIGRQIVLPRLVDDDSAADTVRVELAPHEPPISAGMGDNASAARGMGLTPGTLGVSLGTSGTVFGITESPHRDQDGYISGFASGDGRYLPLVCTLNAARVITWGASLLGVDLDTFAELALAAPSGSAGLIFTPYLEGERTPNLPDATGSLEGISLTSGSRENFARACVEGMLRNLVAATKVMESSGVSAERIVLIGGAATNPAVQQIAREMFSAPVEIISPGEYVALGASRQAETTLKSAKRDRS